MLLNANVSKIPTKSNFLPYLSSKYFYNCCNNCHLHIYAIWTNLFGFTNNDHKILFFNKKKILENIMIFLPNVSFNSPFVPPTIQHVGLEKMSKNKIK